MSVPTYKELRDALSACVQAMEASAATCCPECWSNVMLACGDSHKEAARLLADTCQIPVIGPLTAINATEFKITSGTINLTSKQIFG